VARMADHLPFTMLCYADAHTPVEFPAIYLITSQQFVTTHKSCDD